MALIDRLKHDPSSDTELVWRHPKENLVLGTQVIVNESQEVVFFKGGKALDVLGPGTHTLSTANLPILQSLINLPFGGATPFAAEVYYVNRAAKLDMTWGTADPMLLLDPQFHIAVPVRAFGHFGISVSDSRPFVTRLAGTLRTFDSEDLKRYFQGLLVSRLKDQIAKEVVTGKVAILELSAHLTELAEKIQEPIAAEFAKFGVAIVNLYVVSINVPEDDPSVRKLRDILGTRAEMVQLGDGYRVKRTFDVLEQAASTPGGTAGALLAGGLGVGLGLGVGPALGRQLGSELGTSGAPAAVARLRVPTATCKECSAPVPAGAKFCAGCGGAIPTPADVCATCSSAMIEGAAFCPGCGTKRA